MYVCLWRAAWVCASMFVWCVYDMCLCVVFVYVCVLYVLGACLVGICVFGYECLWLCEYFLCALCENIFVCV